MIELTVNTGHRIPRDECSTMSLNPMSASKGSTKGNPVQHQSKVCKTIRLDITCPYHRCTEIGSYYPKMKRYRLTTEQEVVKHTKN